MSVKLHTPNVLLWLSCCLVRSTCRNWNSLLFLVGSWCCTGREQWLQNEVPFNSVSHLYTLMSSPDPAKSKCVLVLAPWKEPGVNVFASSQTPGISDIADIDFVVWGSIRKDSVGMPGEGQSCEVKLWTLLSEMQFTGKQTYGGWSKFFSSGKCLFAKKKNNYFREPHV